MFNSRIPQLFFKRLIKSHPFKNPNITPILTNSSSQWWFLNKNIKSSITNIQSYTFSSFQQNTPPPRRTEYQEEELALLKGFQPEKLSRRREVMEKYLQCRDLSLLTPSDITLISEVLSFLAAVHFQIGNRDKGLRYLKEDEDFLKKTGIVDTITVANNYYFQCHFYLDKKNLADAKHYLREVERICKLLGNDKKAKSLLIQCDIYSANMHELQNNPDKALEVYYSIIKRADDLEKEDLPSVMGTIFQSMGTIYKSRNDIEKTMEYWTRNLEISVKYTGESSVRTYQSAEQIANFLYSHDQYQRALPYLNQSLQIALRAFPNKDHPNIAGFYSKVGRIYVEASDLTKGLELIQKAIQIYEKLPLQEFASSLFDCYFLLALIHTRGQRWNEALEAFKKLLEYSKISPQGKEVGIKMAKERMAEIEAFLKVKR